MPPAGGANGVAYSAFGHGGAMRDGKYFLKPRPAADDRYENEKRLLSILREQRGGSSAGDAGTDDGGRCASGAGCGAGPSDPMADFVPRYYGEVQHAGQWFFKMDDLLAPFSRKHIIDIKMGVRCFAEVEIHSSRPRADLFQKMLGLEAMYGSPVRYADNLP